MKRKLIAITLIALLLMSTATALAAAPDQEGQVVEEWVHFSADQSKVLTSVDPAKMPVFMGNNWDANLDLDTTAVFFGNQVNIKGNYKKDVIVFANGATIDANIEGNLYVFASSASIGGKVQGDVFSFSATFQQMQGGTIGTNVNLFCAEALLQGTTGKNAFIFSGSADVSGQIEGNLSGDIDSLTIQDSAKIGGTVTYRSDNAPNLVGSAVSIAVNRLPTVQDYEETPAQKAFRIVFSALRFAGALLLIYLMMFGWAPEATRKINANLSKRTGASFGIGCAVLLGLPIVGFLSMILSVRLGFAILILYTFLLLASVFASLIALFDLIVGRREGMSKAVKLLLVAAFGFVYKLLLAVPILGGIIGFAATIFGVGIIALIMFGKKADKETDELEAMPMEPGANDMQE